MTVSEETDGDPLGTILGFRLVNVCFVRDYLVLVFDRPYAGSATVTVHEWPRVVFGSARYLPGGPGYRDVLCDQIGKVITNAFESTPEGLVIELEGGARLEMDFGHLPDRPEAAMLEGPAGGAVTTWPNRSSAG